ncbi:MAG: class I adenylate-forming enzyme family protein [Reyranellaceae bacterium]
MNPFKGKSYGQSLALVAELHAGKEALVWKGRRFSFAEVKTEVDRASARLAALGLKPGQHLGIWLPNRLEFLWYWLGAMQAGLVPVVLNTRLRLEEAAYQIQQSDCRALIVPGDGAFRDFVADILELCPELVSGQPGSLGSKRFPALDFVLALDPVSRSLSGLTDWSRPAAAELPVPPMALDPMGPAMIAYSSGTTALPKGAVLSHVGFRKAYDHGERFGLTASDRLYLCAPLFGILSSINGVLTFWSRGACVVLDEKFEVERAIGLIEQERCTAGYFFTTMMDEILSHPSYTPQRLASLRTGILVSADPVLKRQAMERLGLRELITSYGMTETYSACTRTYGTEPVELRLRCEGHALPDIEVKVVDPDTGAELPPDAEGEILVRGYNLMLGYYKKPAETAAAFTADGFFRTGDLGRMSADGRLSFLRRVKDGYKHKGFNVSTPEVERVAAQHPDIAQIAVVGVPDRRHGEIGVAFVIPRPGAKVDASSVLSFLTPLLASFKLPAHVFIVDSFPVTGGTEKVQKFKLREIALDRLAEPGLTQSA